MPYVFEELVSNLVSQSLGATYGEQSSAVTDQLLACAKIFDSQGFSANRVDLSDLDFRTLDPSSSTDLDQAFFLEKRGDIVVLHYALADVGAFVESDSPIDLAAWERGVTVYLPNSHFPTYPEEISKHYASLLPDGKRPAIVLEVQVDTAGNSTLVNARRCVIHSKAKLAYEDVDSTNLDPLVSEIYKRITRASKERGATDVELGSQIVIRDDKSSFGVKLVIDELRESEKVNAAMSLAANMAVGKLMLENRTGLFRVLAEPSQKDAQRLRNIANAIGLKGRGGTDLELAWPANANLRDVIGHLDHMDGATQRFLIQCRKFTHGASYALYDATNPPFHFALACVYAHATAPMRRLCDRYVLEMVLCLINPSDCIMTKVQVESALAKVVSIMTQTQGRAAKLDRAIIDLVEALEFVGKEGELFDAVVIDINKAGFEFEIVSQAARFKLSSSDDFVVGQTVSVRLISVDVQAGKAIFELDKS